KLPKLSKGSVEYAGGEMEAGGYIFKKIPSGNTMKYAMTIQNVIDLYNHRKVPKYRDRFDKAFTIFVCNLKGGGSKTVSTASLSHAFRAHPQLLFEDLRILAIDFDPQASLTMFLSHENSVGLVENTAAQAMLQNVSREELLSDFIVPSIIPGVDVIPASID
ncbi:ParA family protein, partial [Klebsiella pneumoniae]|nr:ParA family protein [Klebsiella pneumoniae]